MVKFIKEHVLLVILSLIILAFILYSVINYIIASHTDYYGPDYYDKTYETIPKSYDINEYTNINITDDNMANIYLSDYLHSVSKNISESYYLLDEDYRNKKFGNVDNYINYISNIKISNSIEEYYKKETNEYVIYGIYDKNGNYFVFKTKGVMQYKVYLDDETVEIW